MSGATPKATRATRKTKKRPRISSSVDDRDIVQKPNHATTRRQTTQQQQQKQQPQQQPPNPPPPPPASLVRLLRNDPTVVEYFQALQSNLLWDVEKWKQRTRALEAEKKTWLLLRPQTAEPEQDQGLLQDTPPVVQRTVGPVDTKDNLNDDTDDNPKPSAMTRTTYVDTQNSSSDDDDDDDDPDTWFSLDIPAVPDTTTMKTIKATEPEPSVAATTTTVTKRPTSSFGIHRRNKKNRSSSDDLLSSSDDQEDQDENEDESWNALATGREYTVVDVPRTTAPITRNSQYASVAKRTFHQLSKVYDDLEELGIPLLEQYEKTLHLDKQDPLNPMEEDHVLNLFPPQDQQQHPRLSHTPGTLSTNTTLTTVRRSDQQVATSIFQFLKALSRIKHVAGPSSNDVNVPSTSQRPSFYYPFMSPPAVTTPSTSSTNEHIPCYRRVEGVEDEWQHPAVLGMERLLTSLCWMDVLCPALDDEDYLTEQLAGDETPSLPTPQHQQQETMLLAFQGRKTMVNDLLHSLHGEIVDSWASQDRTTRLQADSTQLDHSITSYTADHHLGDDTVEEHDGVPDSIGAVPYGPKNHLRLSALMERCLHAKLVTTLYLARGDAQSAFQLLWSYLLSTTPSCSMEDHPRLALVQSFCVLEAMLTAVVPPTLRLCSGNDGHPTLLNWMELVLRDGMSVSIFEYLTSTFHFTAAIYRDRNMPHMDDRITDISKVELASYNRLAASISILSVNANATNSTEQLNQVSQTNGVQPPCRVLGILVHVDACDLDDVTRLLLCKLQEEQEITIPYEEFLACVSAKRELEIRQLDNYRRLVNTPMVFTPCHTGKTSIQHYSDQLVHSILTKDLDAVPISALKAAFRSCHIAGDGHSLFRLSSWFMTALSDKKEENVSFQHLLGMLESLSHAVTVRVINLKRRPDRLAAFMSQAMLHRLIVIQGVTDVLHRTRPVGESHFAHEGLIGGFAIDGEGKAAEVEKTLINLVGGNPEDLNRLVETHWFPNELKPFDSEAPNADRRVLISPSEKACALSHIACWIEVERSLAEVNSNPLDGLVFHSLSRFRQRFLVSGYARGPSLSGESKGPTPVCVILEDDAILVDRFSDRLACVLDELPRDFHFCSLGYSRPRTAPLVPFSDHVSVPTSIWYLTGYILSLEGARFLLDRLPVRGPVDSWVGIAMFSNNWDNVFGHSLGVGVSSKMHQDTAVSRANLRKILRFRAFAAAIPLCSQKVGNSSKSACPTGQKSWRQRDTDIFYSGNA